MITLLLCEHNRTEIARVESLGILTEKTGYARNRRFQYDPYVQLFTDEPLRPYAP